MWVFSEVVCVWCNYSSLLFNSKHCVGSHEYIQNCRKWDTEIRLQLLTHSVICRDLARTVSIFWTALAVQVFKRLRNCLRVMNLRCNHFVVNKLPCLLGVGNCILLHWEEVKFILSFHKANTTIWIISPIRRSTVAGKSVQAFGLNMRPERGTQNLRVK